MNSPSAIIRLIRPKEWIKNIFVFVPLFFSKNLFDVPEFQAVLIGAVLFCLAASSIYVLNDLKDAVTDRLHPTKKSRPIARGDVSARVAVLLFVLLSVIGLLGALWLSRSFFAVLLIYYVINIAYCFSLKNIAIIDIYCVAAGFILRMLAGAELIHVALSIWILICTGLLALFLALAKRRDDFVQHLPVSHRGSNVGYNIHFIDTAIVIFLTALMIAYAIYTTQDEVVLRLGTTHFYWTIPVVLFGVLRYLQITLVEERSGSPTTLLLTDKFLLGAVLSWIVISALLIY